MLDKHTDASRRPHHRGTRLSPDAHGHDGHPTPDRSRGGVTPLALQNGAATLQAHRGQLADAFPAPPVSVLTLFAFHRSLPFMSDIAPLGRGRHAQPSRPGLNGRIKGLNGHHPATRPSLSSPADRVDLSDAARLMSKLTETPDVRSELIASVRAMIRAGTYETPEKLDAAVDGLLADLR